MKSKKTQKPALVLLDGKQVHPLVFVRRTVDMKLVAKALGHSNHTTFSIYAGKAAKFRTLPVPAEWVLPLAKLTGLQPCVFRPDLYQPHWLVDNGN